MTFSLLILVPNLKASLVFAVGGRTELKSILAPCGFNRRLRSLERIDAAQVTLG